ncbi:MAG: hypothetical protein J0G32_05975 [Alphaproteobacteria bacterium]|nr:hypothetical protein [Alphaproteobacteria bacterium]
MRKSNNPAGRPRSRSVISELSINIGDMPEFTALSILGFSNEKIRQIYGYSNDTFYGKLLKQPIVQKLLQDGRNVRETIIRLKQMELVMHGNAKMLIHLGKTELGQIPKPSVSNTHVPSTNTFSVFDQEIIDEFLSTYLPKKE